MKRKYNSALERIVYNTLFVPETGCWIWLGTRDGRGYGRVGIFDKHRGKTVKPLAHRWVYSQLVGDIEPGKEIDHICTVRECVAPAHLQEVTHQENNVARVARAMRRRRGA